MYPPITRNIALSLTDAESHNWRVEGRTKPFSDRSVAVMLEIKDRSAIATWRTQANTAEKDIAERYAAAGRKRKMTPQQETKVMETVKKQRRQRKMVQASHIQATVATVTNNNVSVSPSKVSRLAKEHKMSSQRTKRRGSDKNTPQFRRASSGMEGNGPAKAISGQQNPCYGRSGCIRQ